MLQKKSVKGEDTCLLNRTTDFFCTGVIEKFFPGSRRFAESIFFVAFRATFTRRPLDCRFFVASASQIHTHSPASQTSSASRADSSPSSVFPFYFVALQVQFSPAAAAFFFRALRALRLFPARYAAVLFPGAKCSVFPGYLIPEPKWY